MLSLHGVTISVHGLRRRHPDADRLLEERGLPSLHITHNGVTASMRGMVAALKRPVLSLRALGWILRTNRGRTTDLLTSVALLPRAFDILADLERLQPDVVHMYWGHYPTIVGWLVQRRLPQAVTSMSIVAYDLVREYAGAVDVATGADVVRTHAIVNRPHVARFTGLPPERIEVIYNGVDVDWVQGICAKHAKVPRRIVTTGRLIEQKGMDDVLEAFAAVFERWPEATLVVVGDGPDRERLVSMSAALGLRDAVTFLGHVAHERVVEEMSKAEVFVLMSRYAGERLPNVVKEAMASRCVCITSPTPGIEELVDDSVTGFVTPSADPATLSALVDRVFAGSVDAASMAERASAHVARHFDLARTAPTYERLWRAAARRAAHSA